MSTNRKRKSRSQDFNRLGQELKTAIPSLWAVLSEEDDFIEFRINLRPDGSMLAILKRYGDDGGPMVLFANGYGPAGVLMAANAAVQGDAWRIDKPWKGKEA